MEELKSKYVGRYIGPDKITDITVLDFQTALGSAVFEVTLATDVKDTYPEKALAAIVSDEPKDYNHMRDARVNLLVPEIIKLMEEYDLPVGQLVYTLATVGTQFRNHIYRANNYLWRGDDRRYVPGADATDEFTLVMAERINRAIPPREEKPVEESKENAGG